MEKLIAILFLSREVSHRLHLKTGSYSQHMALNDFYDEILDFADSLAESYQGQYGIMENIPYMTWDKNASEVKSLEYLLKMFKDECMKSIDSKDSHLKNVADEVVALFTRTIYKLKYLSLISV